jgi:hypothetical protein
MVVILLVHFIKIILQNGTNLHINLESTYFLAKYHTNPYFLLRM